MQISSRWLTRLFQVGLGNGAKTDDWGEGRSCNILSHNNWNFLGYPWSVEG